MAVSPLYDHQELALRKLSNGKVLWGGVGSGKTRVAIEYYLRNEAPREVIVITTARKRDEFDWQNEFYAHGIGPKAGYELHADHGTLSGAIHHRRSGKGSRTPALQASGSPDDECSTAEGGAVDGDSVRDQRHQELPSDEGRGNAHQGNGRVLHPGHGGGASGLDHHLGGSTAGRLSADHHQRLPEHASSDDLRLAIPEVDEHHNGAHIRGDGECLPTRGNLDQPSSLVGGQTCEAGEDGQGEASVQLAVRDSEGQEPLVGADAGRRGSTALVEDDRSRMGSGDSRFDTGVYPWVLTVDSWQNIAKYADVAGAFFIFDEQRLVGSGDWSRKFLRIAKRNRWILLSATPGDTWMDYIPLFIANGFYKNRSEFKREHVVYNTFAKFPKVDRYINQGKLARLRSQVLVEMPFERHTRRKRVLVEVPYDKQLMEAVVKQRWHVYEERPLNDAAEMCAVARRIVNSDPSRLEMVCELWEKHPKLIVFYNFNYELASLRSLKEYYGIPEVTDRSNTSKRMPISSSMSPSLILPESSSRSSRALVSSSTSRNIGRSEEKSATASRSALWKPGLIAPPSSTSLTSLPTQSGSMMIAEWNGHKHQPLPETDRWLYLVQYTAGAEAWNCITTDAMVKYSQTYSYKLYDQSEGRIDRLNTPFKDLWYYEFISNSWIDQGIWRAMKSKESFNTARYNGIFVG